MNDERSFERFVADHVAGAAGQVRLPDDVYDDIHAFASRTRQRPAWLALIKEPPMRIESKLGVGSPLARIAVIIATTLLLAALGVGALVAGAQSLSPAPPPAAPALSFFTGNAPTTGACQKAGPTVEVSGGVAHERGESWGCLTWTTDDPRFSGVSVNVWNSDAVIGSAAVASGRPGAILAGRERLENEDGAWEGTWTELSIGSEPAMNAGWYVGEGAYDGLVAYVVMTDTRGVASVRGVIMPDDGFGPPEALPEP